MLLASSSQRRARLYHGSSNHQAEAVGFDCDVGLLASAKVDVGARPWNAASARPLVFLLGDSQSYSSSSSTLKIPRKMPGKPARSEVGLFRKCASLMIHSINASWSGL